MERFPHGRQGFLVFREHEINGSFGLVKERVIRLGPDLLFDESPFGLEIGLRFAADEELLIDIPEAGAESNALFQGLPGLEEVPFIFMTES
jgi:hypothetical protein